MLIIASVGIKTVSTNEIRKMVLAGADVLRHNFSYYSIEENIEYIQEIQRSLDELHSSTKHMIDMPLNKIRLGDFDPKLFTVRENEEFILRNASYSTDCYEFIPIQFPDIGNSVHENQVITLGDGEIAVQIIEILDKNNVRIKTLNSGIIKYMKTFNVKDNVDIEKTINSYQEIINKLDNSDIFYQFICVSYIDKETNEKIKKILNKENKKKIVIKIENQNGIDDIEKICKDNFYDLILVDRGELAVNLPYEKLGIYQKQILDITKKLKKPVIVSTQILESAIHNYIPTKSDISDLTNLVLNQVHGVMLCHETGSGIRPAYPVHVAKKIIQTLEKSKIWNTHH